MSNIVKNIFYKYIVEVLRVMLPVIIMPYIYRVFSVDIIGKIEYSRTITAYFFVFAGFGVYTYGLREITIMRENKEKRNEIFSNLFFISFLSSVTIFLIYILYVFVVFKKEILLRNMLLLNSIQLFSYIFYIEWVNEAFEDYKFISRKTTIVKILNLIFIFGFVKISSDFYMYLFLVNIFIFINNFISFIYIKKYIKIDLKNLKLKKYIFALSIVLLLTNVNILYTQLDKIMLGFNNFSKQLAYYTLSQNILSVMMIFLTSIIAVTIPRLAFYIGNNNKVEFENMVNKLIRYTYLLLFPLSIGVIVLRKEILYFFGGEKYLIADFVVIVFSVRLVVVNIQSILTNNIIFLHKKEKIIVGLSLLTGLLNFIFNYILLKLQFFNAVTAIFSTMIAELILACMALIYIKKFLKVNLKIFKIRYFKYFLNTLLFFPSYYIITLVISNNLLIIVSTFILCCLLYLILLFFTKDITIKELFYFIRKEKEKNV